MGWTCEHRWSSIMNMVQFANVAVGEPVQNWQAGNNFLGFSRGSKAFVAMGDLGKDFNTGLPDGESVTSSIIVSKRSKLVEGGDISKLLKKMIQLLPFVLVVSN